MSADMLVMAAGRKEVRWLLAYLLLYLLIFRGRPVP
jgi:hypothetical protein